MHLRRTGLWRHGEFLKLWGGQSVSLLGSQVTQLALPLTAIAVLHAGPVQLGLLGALQYAPELLLGLLAGVWVDRLRRRPLLLGADLVRAVLLGSIPIAAAVGHLSMGHLYVVGMLGGVATVLFSVAYVAYLPVVVGREQLVEGNSKLEASVAVAMAAGPSLGGALVQLVTAPFAITVDALSFVVSVISLALMRTPEPSPPLRAERQAVLREVASGLRFVRHDGLLRVGALSAGVFNLFAALSGPLVVLYFVRELQLAPASIGLLFATSGVGAFLGALVAQRAAAVLGLGAALIGGIGLACLSMLLIPLAGQLAAATVPVLVMANLSFGVGAPVYSITFRSVSVALTPSRYQGRVSATTRLLSQGTRPIGTLVGAYSGSYWVCQRRCWWPVLARA